MKEMKNKEYNHILYPLIRILIDLFLIVLFSFIWVLIEMIALKGIDFTVYYVHIVFGITFISSMLGFVGYTVIYVLIYNFFYDHDYEHVLSFYPIGGGVIIVFLYITCYFVYVTAVNEPVAW